MERGGGRAATCYEGCQVFLGVCQEKRMLLVMVGWNELANKGK